MQREHLTKALRCLLTYHEKISKSASSASVDIITAQSVHKSIRCLKENETWTLINCNFLNCISVYYTRVKYCYKTNNGVPPTPTLEKRDPILMDSHSSRSDKQQKCAKAAMGRGFMYFLLFNNGECLASYDDSYNYYSYEITTSQYCYNYCYWGCYRTCYTYETYCGTGYGDSLRMNLFKIYYCKLSQ